MPETYKEMKSRLKNEKRQIVFNKYGGKCSYCGCEINIRTFHLDHFIPKRRGCNSVHHANYNKPRGNEDIENMYPSCGSCNSSKSDLSLEEFRITVAYRITMLNKYSVPYNTAKRFGLVQETNKPVIFYFETLTNG